MKILEGNNGYKVLFGKDICDSVLSEKTLTYFKQLMAIDAEAYGGDEKGEDCVYVGVIDNYINRFGYESSNLNAKLGKFGEIDNIIAVSKDDIIIGYINYLTMGDELFNEIINPDINAYLEDPGRRDDGITGKQLAHWKNSNNLFILSIAVKKEYRDSGIIKILTNEFLNELREKDEAGYKINSITADTVSDHGEKIMKMFRSEIVMNENGPVILPAPDSDESGHEVIVRICKGENMKDLLKLGFII